MSQTQVYIGTGRRKRATARVRVMPGNGKTWINGKSAEEYFAYEQFSKAALAPFHTIERDGQFDIRVLVNGGGINGQSAAIAMGIARALQKMDPELRVPLKRAGHLRRDPRERERKKSGQPGARKKFQFSKR
ncbi:MAG: 30S ribosomal protein S9 [Puniceicoccaceae bacterium]